MTGLVTDAQALVFRSDSWRPTHAQRYAILYGDAHVARAAGSVLTWRDARGAPHAHVRGGLRLSKSRKSYASRKSRIRWHAIWLMVNKVLLNRFTKMLKLFSVDG